MAQYNTITVVRKKDAEIMRLNRRVLDQSPDLIAVVGTDYKFYYVNPAYMKIHNLKAKDFMNRHINKFVGDNVFEKIVKPKLTQCFKGEDVHYEEWFDFPAAGVLYMDVRYLPMADSDGVIDRVAIVLRDITCVKKAENAKVYMDKLNEFKLASRAFIHNINNPLSTISGYIELLKLKETEPAKIENLDTAFGEIGRLVKIIAEFKITHILNQSDTLEEQETFIKPSDNEAAPEIIE